MQGLSLSDGLDGGTFFAGRLAMGSACLMGHSYGGASVTALIAEDDHFKCSIALDPWWRVPSSVHPHRMLAPIPSALAGTLK